MCIFVTCTPFLLTPSIGISGNLLTKLLRRRLKICYKIFQRYFLGVWKDIELLRHLKWMRVLLTSLFMQWKVISNFKRNVCFSFMISFIQDSFSQKRQVIWCTFYEHFSGSLEKKFSDIFPKKSWRLFRYNCDYVFDDILDDFPVESVNSSTIVEFSRNSVRNYFMRKS